MSTYPLIRRFSLIIEKVQKSPYSTLAELMEYLHAYGFEYSDRTLKRDIRRIREDFHVEVAYCDKERGYYIDESLSDDLEKFLRFLEMANTADLIGESLKEAKENLRYFHFDAQGSLRGVETLKPLLRAAVDHKKVSFVHENYFTEARTPYLAQPYLLKEYLNRWYLVAFVENLGEFRSFGIDRIHELEVTDELFAYDENKQPENFFKNIIGLDYSNKKVETILLSLTPKQMKYIKSLPLHRSQQVISENEEECLLRLRLAPNYEFLQKLLSLGDQARVVEPDRLKTEVKAMITAMAENYEK